MKTKYWLLLILLTANVFGIVGAQLGIRQERRREIFPPESWGQCTYSTYGDSDNPAGPVTCTGPMLHANEGHAPTGCVITKGVEQPDCPPVTPQALNPIQK
jgi:hypothetical protein